MKKLLLILGFCSAVNLVSAQDGSSFQDNHHALIGNITQNGSIIDQNNKFLGQFKVESNQWCVIDSHHKTVGYIVGGNEIQDLGHNTLGYLITNKTDYSVTVQNASHTAVGRIKADGTVESATHGIVGYAMHTEPMWAAPYYFFFKL